MVSLNDTLKKKWVGRAMGNETIYWDGLKAKLCYSGSTQLFEMPWMWGSHGKSCSKCTGPAALIIRILTK